MRLVQAYSTDELIAHLKTMPATVPVVCRLAQNYLKQGEFQTTLNLLANLLHHPLAAGLYATALVCQNHPRKFREVVDRFSHAEKSWPASAGWEARMYLNKAVGTALFYLSEYSASFAYSQVARAIAREHNLEHMEITLTLESAAGAYNANHFRVALKDYLSVLEQTRCIEAHQVAFNLANKEIVPCLVMLGEYDLTVVPRGDGNLQLLNVLFCKFDRLKTKDDDVFVALSDVVLQTHAAYRQFVRGEIEDARAKVRFIPKLGMLTGDNWGFHQSIQRFAQGMSLLMLGQPHRLAVMIEEGLHASMESIHFMRFLKAMLRFELAAFYPEVPCAYSVEQAADDLCTVLHEVPEQARGVMFHWMVHWSGVTAGLVLEVMPHPALAMLMADHVMQVRSRGQVLYRGEHVAGYPRTVSHYLPEYLTVERREWTPTAVRYWQKHQNLMLKTGAKNVCFYALVGNFKTSIFDKGIGGSSAAMKAAQWIHENS